MRLRVLAISKECRFNFHKNAFPARMLISFVGLLFFSLFPIKSIIKLHAWICHCAPTIAPEATNIFITHTQHQLNFQFFFLLALRLKQAQRFGSETVLEPPSEIMTQHTQPISISHRVASTGAAIAVNYESWTNDLCDLEAHNTLLSYLCTSNNERDAFSHSAPTVVQF